MKSTRIFCLFLVLAGAIIVFSYNFPHQSNSARLATPSKNNRPPTPEALTAAAKHHQHHHQAAKSSVDDQGLRIIDLAQTAEVPLLGKIVAACPKIARNDGGFGTSFLISKSGLLVTDLHVVGKERIVSVKFYALDKKNPNVAREILSTRGIVVGESDEKTDLAFILPDQLPNDVQPLTVETEPQIGPEPVWRFGYGKGYRWAYGLYLPRDSEIEQSAKRRIVMFIEPGASGGPVVNGFGEVIGIVQNYNGSTYGPVQEDSCRTARYELTQSVNYFLPIDFITKFLCEHPIPYYSESISP